MKNFFSLLAALLLVPFAAQAATSITLRIDHPERLSATYRTQTGTDEPLTLVAGDNTVAFDWISDADTYSSVAISLRSSDYKLVSVHCVQTNTDEYVYSSSCYINVNGNSNGYVYVVTTATMADLRTAKATFVVDEPSAVNLQRKPAYENITLEQTTTEIAFIPDGTDKETFSLSLKDYSARFYQVLLNGEVQPAPAWGNTYSLDLKDGDRVEAKVNFPDVDVPIRLVSKTEASQGFITAVTVNGEAVAGWETGNFTVKLGSTLSISANTSDYALVSAQFDDESPITYWYNPQTFFIGTEGTHTFTYEATPYATFDITVNIDHPERITLYKGYSYENNPITLVAGTNTVTLSERAGGISFKAAGGCWVETFVDQNGNEYQSLSSYTLIQAKEGDVFTITTGAVERNHHAVLYVDDPTVTTQGGMVSWYANDDYDNQSTAYTFHATTSPQIQAGYNDLTFDADFDNPLVISLWALEPENIYFYHNDTLLDHATSIQLTVADEDVVKVFLRAAPETFYVDFAEAEDCTDCGFTDIVRDQIVPVADLEASLSVLTGTEISFRLTGTNHVTANGAALTADDNGVYTLSVNANTTLVAGGTPTALDHIDAALNTNVYTLQGVLLIREATEDQINALPAGLYIINGRTTYLLNR